MLPILQVIHIRLSRVDHIWLVGAIDSHFYVCWVTDTVVLFSISCCSSRDIKQFYPITCASHILGIFWWRVNSCEILIDVAGRNIVLACIEHCNCALSIVEVWQVLGLWNNNDFGIINTAYYWLGWVFLLAINHARSWAWCSYRRSTSLILLWLMTFDKQANILYWVGWSLIQVWGLLHIALNWLSYWINCSSSTT